MATTYLYRDATSATGVTAATISCWVKKVKTGVEQTVWFSGYTADYGQYSFRINFNTDDTLRCMNDDAGVNFKLETNRKFRDTNGWYHICLALDTSESAADRGKLYINGVRETSFSTDTNMTGDQFFTGKSGYRQVIGRDEGGSDDYFDGLMSYYYYIDGTAYPASTFGETDATTGQWKINTNPTVTMGTNGFLVLKNGNTITDQSSNSNNLTLGGGAVLDMKDCPSDVYATMNSLDNYEQGSTFTICNTKLEWNTNNKNNFANFAMNKGKFYWELKYANITGGANAMVGMSLVDTRQPDDYPGHDATAWSYYASSGNKYNNGGSSYGDSWTTNDIIGVAFDADTRTLWFSKNGVWQNSATISEIAAGTTTNAAWTGMGSAGEWFIPCMSGYDGNKAEFNFGNGYFSTTPISDEGTNASGVGKFEYDVPNNFTALSTKGLNI